MTRFLKCLALVCLALGLAAPAAQAQYTTPYDPFALPNKIQRGLLDGMEDMWRTNDAYVARNNARFARNQGYFLNQMTGPTEYDSSWSQVNYRGRGRGYRGNQGFTRGLGRTFARGRNTGGTYGDSRTIVNGGFADYMTRSGHGRRGHAGNSAGYNDASYDPYAYTEPYEDYGYSGIPPYYGGTHRYATQDNVNWWGASNALLGAGNLVTNLVQLHKQGHTNDKLDQLGQMMAEARQERGPEAYEHRRPVERENPIQLERETWVNDTPCEIKISNFRDTTFILESRKQTAVYNPAEFKAQVRSSECQLHPDREGSTIFWRCQR